ncbi:MAG: response regulator transcription factor [Chloroflexi bacterium]|nr:response regulator transcription factor [Chloroflexota bacterium]
MMNPIRVVLADDFPVVRMGIKNLLNQTEDIAVVGEAGSGTEAVNLVNELNPDILLLDMELPELQGVDVVRKLFAAHSPVRILALSAYDDKHYVLSLLEMGAAGYLIKDEAAEMIVEAVRGVASGERGWISRGIAAQLPVWVKEEVHNTSQLTQRETEVLRLVINGKTNQFIGVTLGISEKTVEKYLDSIFKKLGATSRTDAAVKAVRDHLV